MHTQTNLNSPAAKGNLGQLVEIYIETAQIDEQRLTHVVSPRCLVYLYCLKIKIPLCFILKHTVFIFAFYRQTFGLGFNYKWQRFWMRSINKAPSFCSMSSPARCISCIFFFWVMEVDYFPLFWSAFLVHLNPYLVCAGSLFRGWGQH